MSKIEEKLPKDLVVSEIRFEGSEIIIYTRSREYIGQELEFIKELVSELKKRIIVRPDPSLCKSPEEAEKIIKEMAPEEAGIKQINFQPEFSLITIEAEKPGLLIGKKGELLREMKKATMWDIRVRRAPILHSDIIKTLREMLYQESAFRKEFLDKVGRRIHSGLKEPEWARISFLGSGREVGRSCLLLQTPESRVLLDCGIKPGNEDEPPYFSAPEFDLKSIDAIILSHAHLDHCGLIPYLYEYGYKGPLYCTIPTRDLMVLLTMDYIELLQKEGKKPPYSTKGIKEAVKRCITLEYEEVTDITPDMRLTFFNSGHILGGSVVHIHIGEGKHNIVYTGDYKFERTALFDPTSYNFTRCETIITESTYGVDRMPPRKDAEQKILEEIYATMKKGGKVLIPSFAVGRAQEIMVILAKNNFEYPVYLDGMIWDALAIHTAYPEYLGREIQKMIFKEGNNPFLSEIFKRVGSQKERMEVINSQDPSVIIATSGMLSGGPAIEYLKYLAEDEKNKLMFVGYQSEGTLGRKIQKGWKEVPLDFNGKKMPVQINCEVVTIEGLSGHSDQKQIINYFKRLKCRPHKVLTNHGEASKCVELAKSIHKLFRVETMAPKNLEAIRLF